MEIKCRNRIFNVSREDLILDNGACYTLITQEYFSDLSYMYPNISKKLFATLKKNGDIELSKKKYKTAFGYNENLKLWQFTHD